MLDKRIMGLDYGSKTIGVAVSDLLGFTAQGIETININEQVKDFKIKRIKELVQEHNVGKIVVFLPKNMDNSVGFRGEATHTIGKMLISSSSIVSSSAKM